MGDLLPLPDELKPQKPIDGQEFEIKASLSAELNEGKIRVIVRSNIPKETPIILTLKGKQYYAQSKATVHNNEIASDWFSDKGDPIKNGFYIISVSCPIYDVLPNSVKTLFGVRNRNLSGKCVKFDPIGGNTINISYGLLVSSSSIQVIDMQQKLSDI